MTKLYFRNPNGEEVWKCIFNLVSKFRNDPTVNKSGIVVLVGQVLGLYGKGEGYDEKGVSITLDNFLQFQMVRMFGNEFQT